MAAEKISALGALGAAPVSADLLVLVDISDLTMAPTGTTKRMTMANLQSFIGAVTGSGTINRVAKFTAAGIVGDSQIFDDGTGVGIGTLSPAGLLHVSDLASSLFADTIFKVSTGVGGENLQLRGNGSVGVGMIPVNTKILSVNAGLFGNSGLAIYNNGAVLQADIGTFFGVGGSIQLWNNAGTIEKVRLAPSGAGFNNYMNFDGDLAITAVNRIGLGGAGTSDTQVTVRGVGATSATFAAKIFNGSGTLNFSVRDDGTIYAPVQTGNAGLVAGELYQDTAANILANGDNIVGIKV